MNHTETYHDLLNRVKSKGTWKGNRTDQRALFVPGHMMEFDMSVGFPLLTTKKMAFRSIFGELIGFLLGYTSAAEFRSLGCKIWDANANDPGTETAPNRWLTSEHRSGEDDLGRIYGAQWRAWGGDNGRIFDQITDLLISLEKNPLDRRMIVNAWNVKDIKEGRMALPPCHILHQALYEPEGNKLHMTMYQRSCDTFLGIPFNIASYAALLHLYAASVGMVPGKLIMFLADVHIYENHMEQVEEQLSRTPFQDPGISHPIVTREAAEGPDLIGQIVHGLNVYGLDYVDQFRPTDYLSHPAIKAPMAV